MNPERAWTSRISIVEGDITREQVDAIVNAANEAMLGGGGVDGAIHRAAGPELLEACRGIDQVRPGVRCPTGECRATPGFALPARAVIHTVGPVWRGGQAGELADLASCYTNALTLARKEGWRRVAFPSISCGAYRFPPDRAAAIAIGAIGAFLCQHDSQLAATQIDEVRLVAFDAGSVTVLREALGRH